MRMFNFFRASERRSFTQRRIIQQEMDRARRAHAEKLERDQAERAKERQEAEAKSRSREALFNTPFAGVLGGMG